MSNPRSTTTPSEVTMADELLAPVTTGMELCYQTFGSPDDEPLLLVMGLGGQLTWWPEDLCRALAARGHYVIRYDNRDVGRSSRAVGRVRPDQLVRGFLGRPVRAPYAIDDLAADAFGLLDHLGLASAHVAGISMGGMIAQTMALAAPERVRSLASIMSTTGRRRVGWQNPALLPTLIGPRASDVETYAKRSLVVWGLIGSPAFPSSAEDLQAKARETWARGVDEVGVARQMLAIVTQPDRTRALQGLTMPALVMHGLADKMVHVSGGRATAAAIPGARSVFVEGWGHDLPEQMFPTLVREISANAARGA